MFHQVLVGGIQQRLRYEPLSTFRSTYAYTNFGMTAGADAVAAAAGTDRATLSEQTLYGPLGMTSQQSGRAPTPVGGCASNLVTPPRAVPSSDGQRDSERPDRDLDGSQDDGHTSGSPWPAPTSRST
jgi:CubicO group peptidase (beta-lactamase class C family)